MARSTPVLGPMDERSDEDTLQPMWQNPNPLSPQERRALVDHIAAQMPPQTTSSVDLVREDRDR